MEDTAKYLIHAEVATDGVVERTDVVGAVFGQLEGLLGEELELHDLQETAKLGRIDVGLSTESGRAVGTITVATDLDRVETAILGAALETIEQIGPCRAQISVDRIEDVRAAKRRAIVERAQELLVDGFDEGAVAGEELVESVRSARRAATLTTYEGLPAGPRVADGDAVIVVEGRADVRRLLEHGVKTAVAVEGTDVPEAVVELTRERTATAFFDGDRGGELILRELAQRGDLDFVAAPPDGVSVEDLSREDALAALRAKRPVETALAALDDDANGSGAEATTDLAAAARADGARLEDVTDGPIGDSVTTAHAETAGGGAGGSTAGSTTGSSTGSTAGTAADHGANTPPEARVETSAQEPSGVQSSPPVDGNDGATDPTVDPTPDEPRHLADRVEAVSGSGRVVCLDADGAVLADEGSSDAVVTLRELDAVPHAVVVGGALTQALVDVAARRGVELVIGDDRSGLTKQPTGLRVHTAAELRTG